MENINFFSDLFENWEIWLIRISIATFILPIILIIKIVWPDFSKKIENYANEFGGYIKLLFFLSKLFGRDSMEKLAKFRGFFEELNIDSKASNDVLKEVFFKLEETFIKLNRNINNIDKIILYQKFIANDRSKIILYTLFTDVLEEYNIKLDKYEKEILYRNISNMVDFFKEINKEKNTKIDDFLQKEDMYFLYSTKDFLIYYLDNTKVELEEIKKFLIIDSIRNIKKINVLNCLILNEDWPFQVDIIYPDYLNIEIEQVFSSINIDIKSSNDLIEKIKYNLQNNKSFSYLVLGESGIGKTTLLTHLFYEILSLYKEEKTSFIPLFFEIKDIPYLFKPDNGIENYKDYIVFILNEFLKRDINDEKELATVMIDKNDGKVYFKYKGRKKSLEDLFNFIKVFSIFDSLDEAYQNVKKGGLIEQKYDFFPYLVSSRTNYFLETIYVKHNFNFSDAVFEIKKWNSNQIKMLIEALNERLRNLYDISTPSDKLEYIYQNVDNPLLAILLLFTYIYKKDYENIKDITKNKSILYKSFFETWIKRESKRKGSIFFKVKKELEKEEDLYKLFSDSAIFFAWLLYNKQIGVNDKNIRDIIDRNLDLSIKLEDKLPEILSIKGKEIYLYNFLKHNKILKEQYKKFLNGENIQFEDLFLSTELKSILQTSEKKIDKFIHESFMEFFIAVSIIRELSLDYKEVNFNILAYYYRYDITRFILGLFEYYSAKTMEKLVNNLKIFLKKTLNEKNLYDEILLYQSNWAGYFLSRILFHNKNLNRELYRKCKDTLIRTIKQEIPHIVKRTAYIGLITLGDKKIEKEYLSKLTKECEFFWFNIGDVLIYYNDKKKNENISLDSWKANLDEFLEGEINWNFTKKMSSIDILGDESEKNRNLRNYKIKTFLHLVKLELIGEIYRYLKNIKNNIDIEIIFNREYISFKFSNIDFNDNLKKEIKGKVNEYLKELESEISLYLKGNEKEFFSRLAGDKDNKFEILFKNGKFETDLFRKTEKR